MVDEPRALVTDQPTDGAPSHVVKLDSSSRTAGSDQPARLKRRLP
jgi:hypothetical protein